MIDTVRVAELNNELGVVQDTIQRAELRAGEIVAELRALIEPSEAVRSGASSDADTPSSAGRPDTSGAEAATVRTEPVAIVASPPGRPSAPVQLVACPDCDQLVKPQGMGTHRRIKHARQAPEPVPAPKTSTCPECQKEVKTIGLGTHRRQKHGRGLRTVLVNPRSLPPMDLGPRMDEAVGE